MGRKNHAETAYSSIKQQIMEKRIVPGQPIIETELAQNLGMSRTPVREAIKRLAAEGHLETIKGRGTFLRTMTIEQLISCYELSEGLEGMLAYHLAEQQKEGSLPETLFPPLETLIEKMDKAGAAGDIPLWIDIDTEFHTRLHRACTNPYLLESLDRLQTYFDSVSLFLVPMYLNTDKDIASQEHRDMIRHIRSGNPDKARHAAQQQRRRIRTFMKNLIRKSGAV